MVTIHFKKNREKEGYNLMTSPLVSILIPVYKRVNLAIEAIDCALSQDYETLEIIVGDNNSPDGTFEKLVEKYGNNRKVFLFQNEKNLGAVGNWEQCLSRAHGKYVKFLWSDDLMAKDYISKGVNLLEKNHKAAFVYSSVKIFTNVNQIKENGNKRLLVRYRFCKETRVINGEEFVKAIYHASFSVPVSPGCAIFRRNKIHIVNKIPSKTGYDHRKNGAGPDVLMFLESIANGESFIYMDYPASFFRDHPGSITSSDCTIMDGYWTAKQYYLREYGLEKYWKSLNSEIISWLNQKKVFNKRKNILALSRFLDDTDVHINDHSVISILSYKFRKNYYVGRLNRKW